MTTETQQTPTQPGDGRARRRLSVIAIAGVVVLLAIAALVVRQQTGGASAPKPPAGNIGTQVDQALPPNILSMPLVDEHGNATNLAAFKGKIVVLTDFMTLCQEVCPITTARLNQADQAVIKAGLADRVQFVEITVDPQRDTPDQLHAYRSFANLPANFSLLTGTPDNLATLWHTLGVGYDRVAEDNPPGINWRTGKPLTYDIQHSDALLFLNPDARERYLIVGMPQGPGAQLTSGELAFLNDEGHDNLKSPDGVWSSDDALQVVSWLANKHISPVD